ncbi:MAG: Imm26 family immunity protein [Spirochaetes bacterium]|nr:Imm26 family immunity protein [Spirochaetota bacterium]
MAKDDYKTGDVFTFQSNSGSTFYGRIVLDFKKQCVQPKLIERANPLYGWNGMLLVEVFKNENYQDVSNLLIPGVVVNTRFAEKDAWQFIDNIAVDPEQVDFPEAIIAVGMNLHFSKGEVRIELPIHYDYYKTFPARLSIKNSMRLGKISEHYVKNPESKDGPLSQSDIRFTSYHSDIWNLTELDPKMSYYDLAMQHGFDTKRFYQ